MSNTLKFFDCMEQMEVVTRCIQLYSGGLDSRYFLHIAKKRGISVLALRVLVGTEDPTEVLAAAEAARIAGAEYIEVDATDTFAAGFVSGAILFNARYGNLYPVCSSLSRPLIAMQGVQVARQRNIDCIVHNATWVQNSAARFNAAIRFLAPEIRVAVPFARTKIDRATKLQELREAGIPCPVSGVHSVDANLWGRVIEAGSLDDPSSRVPESVFRWTSEGQTKPASRVHINLTFERGLPVALDGTRMPLKQLIEQLNSISGRFGIGRYNGLEDTSQALGGVKNHEVREAPGASAIIEAHLHLEQAILNQDELRWKAMIDWEWARLVVDGQWFSSLKSSLDGFGERLAQLVTGDVDLELSAGRVFVSAVRSGLSPSYWNVGQEYEGLLANLDIGTLWALRDLPASLRNTER